MTRSALKQRLKKLRAERNAVGLKPTPVNWRVRPLSADYRRDDDFEARRAAFYADMARVFSFEGWRFDKYENELVAAVGFGGRGRSVLQIDPKRASYINESAAPLEWLVSRSMIETKNDRPGAGLVRFAVGLRFREQYSGAQLSPLKAQSIDAPSSGSGPGTPFNDYMLDCMNDIDAVKNSMSSANFKILVDVVCNDSWIWEGLDDRRRREEIIHLHRILDRAGCTLGYVTATEYEERWQTAAQRGPQHPASSQDR